MNDYNISDEQKRILRELVKATENGHPNRFLSVFNSMHYGVIFEQNLPKQLQQIAIECDDNDLEALKADGLITLRSRGIGQICQKGFDAVKSDFATTPPQTATTAGVIIHGDVHGGSLQGAVGNGNIQTIGDFAKIHEQLKKAGVTQSERNEIENILDGLKTASESEKHSLMRRGRDWLERNGPAIGAVLGGAIKGYFG
jgi:hypothetical protein